MPTLTELVSNMFTTFNAARTKLEKVNQAVLSLSASFANKKWTLKGYPGLGTCTFTVRMDPVKR